MFSSDPIVDSLILISKNVLSIYFCDLFVYFLVETNSGFTSITLIFNKIIIITNGSSYL